MPAKYITTEKFTVSTPCGERKEFKSKPVAKTWLSLHKKRCACCEGTETYTSERDHRVRLDNQREYENELVARQEHDLVNQTFFRIMND
jgi:hypothetical protein